MCFQDTGYFTVGSKLKGYRIFGVWDVAGQNEIQVKMILTYFDSQFPLSLNPNYSWSIGISF